MGRAKMYTFIRSRIRDAFWRQTARKRLFSFAREHRFGEHFDLQLCVTQHGLRDVSTGSMFSRDARIGEKSVPDITHRFHFSDVFEVNFHLQQVSDVSAGHHEESDQIIKHTAHLSREREFDHTATSNTRKPHLSSEGDDWRAIQAIRIVVQDPRVCVWRVQRERFSRGATTTIATL